MTIGEFKQKLANNTASREDQSDDHLAAQKLFKKLSIEGQTKLDSDIDVYAQEIFQEGSRELSENMDTLVANYTHRQNALFLQILNTEGFKDEDEI